jgi:hypothetical protein
MVSRVSHPDSRGVALRDRKRDSGRAAPAPAAAVAPPAAAGAATAVRHAPAAAAARRGASATPRPRPHIPPTRVDTRDGGGDSPATGPPAVGSFAGGRGLQKSGPQRARGPVCPSKTFFFSAPRHGTRRQRPVPRPVGMAASPSVVADRLEGVKENVQPVKRGRDAARAALGAVGGGGGGGLRDAREAEKA